MQLDTKLYQSVLTALKREFSNEELQFASAEILSFSHFKASLLEFKTMIRCYLRDQHFNSSPKMK